MKHWVICHSRTFDTKQAFQDLYVYFDTCYYTINKIENLNKPVQSMQTNT